MTFSKLSFKANCKTTAMAIMPHTNIKKALDLALSLDIPFWPQLPNISFHEDAYVQTSENFPGIIIDQNNEKISFKTSRFIEELDDYSRKMAEPETFALSKSYSDVYHSFLDRNLGDYPAVRGQVTGPVSFGFRVADEDSRPIIYNDEAKTLLYDFIQRKANIQYHQLKAKNSNVFVWLDEPGLGWVFSGLSGYSDIQAKEDYRGFLAGLDGVRALHLCASVNLPYLLELGIDLLSFDAYQIDVMPIGYVSSVSRFIKDGGVISWGIVPTDSTNLSKETPETLAKRLLDYWEVISRNTSLSVKQIAEQSLIAPARCCLKNIGKVGASDDTTTTSKGKDGNNLTVEENLVETAFAHLLKVSAILKDRFAF